MQRFSREAAAATGIAVSGAPIPLLNVYSVASEPASHFGTPRVKVALVAYSKLCLKLV